MDSHHALLGLLADGVEHDLHALAASLALSPAELGRALERVRGMGVELAFSSDRRVRWRDPVDLLDRERIVGALNRAAAGLLADLRVLMEVDSTNRFLLDAARGGAPSGMACMAECQSAGRGSRGRGWISPLGNLYLSILWRFASAARLHGLSLALGVAVVEALRSIGIEALELKWPNDLTRSGKKVGGILIETVLTARGSFAVAGIGVNYRSSRLLEACIDQAWTALGAGAGRAPDRNHVAAKMVEGLLTGLAEFERLGLTAFLPRWRALDALRGRRVRIAQPNREVEAEAYGIDGSGALLIRTEGGIERVHAGEVRVRPLD
jgi:BirA family biotin operon repressor/biotin-[acetyl-CoA-carboxylase] ligase